MNRVTAFACGLVFALGLGLSGMTQPGRVIGFLDVAGNWDPTLAVVLATALALGLVATPAILRRAAPLFEERFSLPVQSAVDFPLLLGAVLFGAGWGLAGWCPGPALVSLATLSPPVLFFTGAMLLGMFAGERVRRGLVAGQDASRPGPADVDEDG